MPTATIWLRIGKHDIRVLKQKVGNAIVLKDPDLQKKIGDEPVRSERTIAKCHWEEIGTGRILKAETVLKDEKGEVVPGSKALCILEKTSNAELNARAEAVDKKKIQFFVLEQDGSATNEVRPFLPTERIEVMETAAEVADQGQAYWVSTTAKEGFLIDEIYELPAADPHNDELVYEDAEAAAKRDEIAILTYSNGGFKQFYAFLVPFFKDGKFEWQLQITNKQMEYRCLHDVPGTPGAIRQVKTLDTLPPIQALLTVPTAKKKQ